MNLKLILQQIPIFVQFVNSFVFKFHFNKFPFKNELKLSNFDTCNLRRVEHCVHKIIFSSHFDEYSHWHFSENFFISFNKWDIGTAFSKEIKLWIMPLLTNILSFLIVWYYNSSNFRSNFASTLDWLNFFGADDLRKRLPGTNAILDTACHASISWFSF